MKNSWGTASPTRAGRRDTGTLAGEARISLSLARACVLMATAGPRTGGSALSLLPAATVPVRNCSDVHPVHSTSGSPTVFASRQSSQEDLASMKNTPKFYS